MPSPSQKDSSRSQARMTQHRRLLQLDSPLGTDILLPQRLIATERLSHGYEVSIDVLATEVGIALEQLIAQPVTLWIRQHQGHTLPLHGYVHSARRLGSDGDIDFCQLAFSSWLHFLRFRKDARIWQDKTTEDILADVFDCHPQARGQYRFELERPSLSRSYCTQYETDWHFVQRLMEEEGWFAHHEQREDGSGHVLVITDNTWSLPGLPQQGIAFHGAAPRDELDKILHWSASRTLSSKTWRGRSDDYKSPRMQKEAEEQVMPEYGQLPAQLEMYEYTGAYSFAQQAQGNRQADLQVEQVPRIGQEVIVSFLNGDPDRPVVTGRLFNGEQRPQWHSNGRLSGVKSKEFGGTGFNQMVMDDTPEQNRIHLYSTNTHAQLNLGHLVSQTGNERRHFFGSGFALSTDAYGAIVTHKGLYISTYGRPGAQGTQLDAREATGQLKSGATLSRTLSETAAKAGAEALAGHESLRDFIDATQADYEDPSQAQANRFKQAILLAASPDGIGLTTSKGVHAHAGAELTLSSGTDTSIAAGKSLLASVAEKIGLFAFKAGIKLFSAKGKVEVQAQSDDLDLIAEKVARLLSTSGRVEIHAKDEVVISAGGSFIRINAAGITHGTAGTWEAKASQHAMTGPARLSYAMPLLPASDLNLPKRYPYSQ